MAEGNGSGDVRNGFVVLHRSIQDHPRYRRGHWFRVFADMEMEAAHRGYKREFDGKIIFVKPGQLITDRVSFGNKLGICPGTLEEIWAKMKADGDISWEARPGSKGRLFTIHGYVERQTKMSPHTLRTKLPRNPTANFIGESTPCPTANRQRTDSHHRCTTRGQGKQGNKRRGSSNAWEGSVSAGGERRSFFSSFEFFSPKTSGWRTRTRVARRGARAVSRNGR